MIRLRRASSPPGEGNGCTPATNADTFSTCEVGGHRLGLLAGLPHHADAVPGSAQSRRATSPYHPALLWSSPRNVRSARSSSPTALEMASYLIRMTPIAFVLPEILQSCRAFPISAYGEGVTGDKTKALLVILVTIPSRARGSHAHPGAVRALHQTRAP